MAQGNRGFAEGLTKTGTPQVGAARLPPRTGMLDARDNRLAELASGGSLMRMQELIDPTRCRIWEGHNRDYAALTADNCADLIESFKAQGRQEVPAIVRRVANDPAHAFEVICGARRHWTACWMRAHTYPDFRFLIEPRELSDEEAFRIADLENRSRRDLSDYERACDYSRAVERYYGGSQQRMAERLEVSKSWLSRYLELAKLPAEVVAAFGSPHVIGISHGAALAPRLRVPESRNTLLVEAACLASAQARLMADSAPAVPPGAILQRLLSITRNPEQPSGDRQTSEYVVRALDGGVLVSGDRAGRGGGLQSRIPSPEAHERRAVLNACRELLEKLSTRGRAKRMKRARV